MTFGTIEQAIDDLRNGRIIIVADDEDRENEGDLVCSAELVTPDLINFMTLHGRGLICLALTPERCDQLGLAQMAHDNTEQMGTAFTVSIDAERRFGVSTGISAAGRVSGWISTWRSTPKPGRRTSGVRGTSSRCGPGRAGCCSAWGRPRRAWTWRGSLAWCRPA
jgi:3,4-dihydroxy 2-butanone 4-phosphate synthase / GTP cyclohydrolase II